MITSVFAPGKIILAGEYAVTEGYPGLAIPAHGGVRVRLEPGDASPVQIIWKGPGGHPAWHDYVRQVVMLCEKQSGMTYPGTLEIEMGIPAGKGMGSSTAVVIGVTRALLGENCEVQARRNEDILNPGHSGLDFAVVWSGAPIVFRKGDGVRNAEFSVSSLGPALLIDTGEPGETTPALVAWLKTRLEEPSAREALVIIGGCTERLLRHESPITVFRDHHRAQVALGVVPPDTQHLITAIEQAGGAAKVIGAGGRTGGGGGMVLALHSDVEVLKTIAGNFPVHTL